MSLGLDPALDRLEIAVQKADEHTARQVRVMRVENLTDDAALLLFPLARRGYRLLLERRFDDFLECLAVRGPVFHAEVPSSSRSADLDHRTTDGYDALAVDVDLIAREVGARC